MGVKVDLRVLELLASRLCHDLISPIGAVGNGLELIEDAGPEMSGDALQLSVNCVRRASALLEFFRMAYGAAGSDTGVGWDVARQLSTGLLEGGKTTLRWEPLPVGLAQPPGSGKLALNLTLLGTEMLPRGGEIAVGLQAAAGSQLVLAVTASGRDARIPEEMATVMAADPATLPQLSAKTIHAYFTCRLAESYSGRLEATVQAPSVRLSVSLPAA